MNGGVRAIGFDLGETLLFYDGAPLSWKTLYPDALRFVAARCGWTVGAEQVERAAEVLETYNTRIHPRTTEVDSAEVFDRVLACWDAAGATAPDAATEHFFYFFQRNAAAYEDAPGALTILRAQGVRIGVLTDVAYGMPRRFVERDLDATGLRHAVDVLLTSADVGFRKPEPAGYLRLAALLGVEPRDMWFVGNEPKDIEGANRAGMRSVLLDRDGARPEWGQASRIGSLRELL